MKKCTVGPDAHKESNVLALAFKDAKSAIVRGKVLVDLMQPDLPIPRDHIMN